MWETKTIYQVAVWWPLQGYGGVWQFDTLAEAERQSDLLLAGGYQEVHIRRVETELVKQTKPKPRPLAS